MKELTKEYLISEMHRFFKENGKPPISKDFDKSTDYPSRKTYYNYFGSFGNALVEAGFEYRGIENHQRKIPYLNGEIQLTKEDIKNYVEKYIQEYNEIPSLRDIEKLEGYPNRNDFRRLFGGFDTGIKEMGYTPKHIIQYTDEELEKSFMKFVNENGRIPSIMEFNDSEYPSFWCYQSRFGSWKNAVKHYGFERYKSIEELKNDLICMCNKIYQEEGRRIITGTDISNCDFCSSLCCYSKNIRKYLNMTLREFLDSIGFTMMPAGFGMIFEFEDGEITKSKYEYDVSIYLRSRNINYIREVRYETFVNTYHGKKDCDYVIIHNKKIWYVEVAGMLDGSNNKINNTYRSNLKEKIQMLESNKLNYKIIYPKDLKNKNIDEIFSFIN